MRHCSIDITYDIIYKEGLPVVTNVRKVVGKACDSPQNLRFRELQTLITEVGGYTLDHVDGSHWHYKLDGYLPIGITYSRGHAYVYEVREVVKMFKQREWIR
ncbi:MAG: hypothetical protein KKB90_11605 [Actinobacteria bacterium]|nr:hypothetical protein [Actinomycetota bacterium]MCG2818266.1 hypothetical protein [Actinomycetes bacterium]MBU4219590.1 hypothetical protein [Actinomycetota bacterium]MBU4358803.1 hypothetical protein [Actinomycetota bacterium]MBU4391444.1 hypothetical protein [Actinomycetota bacterium]